MGQGGSSEAQAPRSNEEIVKELANRFAEKCFTSLELYSLKDNFKGLADQQQNIRYLKEDTIARFLEIPDILNVSPVVFQVCSYVGAFPFLLDAPAVLGLEQMVIAITILTERYKRVLARGSADRNKLLFKALAVYDRKMSTAAGALSAEEVKHVPSDGPSERTTDVPSHVPGFAVDAAGDDDDGEGDDGHNDDDLVLAAFESLDCISAFKAGNDQDIHAAMIPADNFRKLIMLLLLIAPLGSQETLSLYNNRVTGEELDSLRSTADSILAAFLNVETSPGIKFHNFSTVIPATLPNLFNGFNSFFEHFLFSKNLDFSKHKTEVPPAKADPAPLDQQPAPLLHDHGQIMNLNLLSQLSFFLPGESLFRRLRLLYSGAEDGFSMGSFETKVMNWRAPSILLVRGTRLDDTPRAGPESSFTATLPPRRFPNGSKASTLTFGVYVSQPWRLTNRDCFGDTDCTLFQLGPIHDIFSAASLNLDYVACTKPSPSNPHAGVSFGCPPPGKTARTYRNSSTVSLGAVSLMLDSSFEYGVFTHDHEAGGGAYRTSAVRRHNFQDRFEVESLEVWGCGGDAEAKAQAERWAWEAREAEARRKVNLGTGDIEADRALLEMAGLIGGNRSGGSMN